jgi:HAD superfamily hydrolase (TIGR01549 family)
MTSRGGLRAVLFDVGGPLDTEVIYERMADEHIVEELARTGIEVTPDQLADANEWAVQTFAPNAYAAMIWRLAGDDRDIAERVYGAVAARAPERHSARGGFELRAGAGDLLESLVRRGFALGLAANQPADALERMAAAGIARWFTHRGVSGTHGFRKPDVRVFLEACESLGVAPEACVVVGDRIDNDIAPARVLGMRTVLFRTGRHAAQQPRAWDEVADAEVRTIEALGGALRAIIGEA